MKASNGGAAEVCAEYAHWAEEEKRLSRLIGDELHACFSAQREAAGVFEDPDTGALSEPFEPVDHLRRAWADEPGYSPDDPRPPTNATVFGRLRDCPHCTKAYEAILERKEARKRWGIAKRRVRAVGKRVLKARETGDE